MTQEEFVNKTMGAVTFLTTLYKGDDTALAHVRNAQANMDIKTLIKNIGMLECYVAYYKPCLESIENDMKNEEGTK